MKSVGFLLVRLRKSVGILLVLLLVPCAVSYGADEKLWSIQVASYEKIQDAQKDLKRLQLRQFPDVRIEKGDDSAFPYKLFVGRFEQQINALPVLTRVKSLFPGAFQKTVAAPAPKPVDKKPPKQLDKRPPKAPEPKPTVPPPQQVSLPSPTTVPVTVPVTPETVEETPPVEGPATSVLAFNKLGYSKETYLPGATPQFVFHVLNYEGLKSATADLTLRLSSVLSENSSITIEIDDTPLYTKSIKEIGYTPRLTIPVRLSDSNYTKVAILGRLFVTDNICNDISGGNLWMVVSNKSQLILNGVYHPKTVSHFFRDYETDFNVAFDPEKVNFEALPLFYYIHQLNDWKNINVALNAPETAAAKKRTVRVGLYQQDLAVDKEDLLVYEKGTHLLRKSLMDLYITPSMKESVVTLNPEHKKGELYFSEMGIKSFTATGVGDLSFNVPMRYSFFSGIPKNPNLELIVNHTPIQSDDRAFLKVFLNGLLIKAFRLEGGGTARAYHVSIPEELLQSYNNNLEFVASYFTDKGGCVQGGSTRKMTFSVSDRSRFYYNSPDREKINMVTDVMGSLSGNVLLMIDQREMFIPGIHLMDLLGKFNRDISQIDVRPWNGEILKGYDFVILLLRPESTKTLDVPLKLDRGRFSIVNPLTEKDTFSIEQKKVSASQEVMGAEFESGFGVLETFDKGTSKVLLLSYYKNPKTLTFLKDIKADQIGRFNGNVVLFNQNTASYTIGNKFRVVYQEARSVPYYWDRFKLPIVLGAGLLVALFLYYVNKKLVRE
jgi:hypothetical protein